jgi:Tol biopolymer transport system component
MTEQGRPQLTDIHIERMLIKRAGSGAPADLVDAIATTVESAGQRAPGLLGALSGPAASRTRRGPRRTWLFVAATLLVGTGVVGASLIGSRLVTPKPVPTTSNTVTNLTAKPSPGPSAPVVPYRAPSWTATGSMRTPQGGNPATLLPSGKVLAAGGADPKTGEPLASAELYDPGSGSWTATGDMITPGGRMATLLRDGKVLVAGAGDGTSAELYDPGTGTWTATGDMITPRAAATATLLPDGKVLVAGGDNDSPGDGSGSHAAELYDPGTGTWTATGSMSTPRQNHTATLLPDGRVLVVGGYDPGGGQRAVAELYDPGSGTWTAARTMVTTGRLDSFTATLLPDGRVLVAGGDVINTGGSGGAQLPAQLPTAEFLASAELYDPGTGTWTATASMTTPRVGQMATLLPDGTVLVAGGSDGGALASAELYDPGSGTPPTSATSPSPSPAPSETQSAVQPGSRVFVYQGFPPSGETQTLWVANLDGTGARALVPDLGGCQGMPAWSPDGTRLLFSRRECAPWTSLGDAGTRLYLTDASGSEPQLVDTGCVAPCVSDSDGAFSSDGRRILFVRLKSIPAALSSATPNALGKVLPFSDVRVLASMDFASGRVTEGGDFEGVGLRWSPDGTQVVFERDTTPKSPSDHPTSMSTIFLADADGRNVHQVGPAGGQMPGWSPDGTRIVFQVQRYSWVGNVIRAFIDIYTIRPDGTDLRRLTTDQISNNPEWGVDGRIWFIRTPGLAGNLGTAGPPQLWTMDADGSNAARPSLSPLLQELLLNYSPPVWQPTP